MVVIVWMVTLLRIGRQASAIATDSAYIDRQMVAILQNVWSALISGGGVLLLLVLWDIDVTPLLASAGIMGIIVGKRPGTAGEQFRGRDRCISTGRTQSATSSSSKAANAAASRTSLSARRSSAPATTSRHSSEFEAR